MGGWTGLGLFLFQALIAVWQLELTNYVEHYGLSRKHLGDGRYEPVRPRHSWNASHTATNWLLINLQRHSDHHTKPDRRFPLLQTYGADEAPQLPMGYPAMTLLAMVPPLWRRRMNPACAPGGASSIQRSPTGPTITAAPCPCPATRCSAPAAGAGKYR